MAVELKVPQVGESITEVQIGQWLKQEGDTVAPGDILVEIETDKVTVELPAPSAGKVGKLLKQGGESARVGEVIGYLEADTGGEAVAAEPAGQAGAEGKAAKAETPAPEKAPPTVARGSRTPPPARAEPAPAVDQSKPGHTAVSEMTAPRSAGSPVRADPATPSDRRAPAAEEKRPREPIAPRPAAGGPREEQVVAMSPLRRRIAERLVQAQQTAALLTTFNEVDMSAVMALRARHQDLFVSKYKTKLGFMSFFVKAAVDALKRFPQINAEVRGTDIIFRNYYDIGVAVSTEKGLVVPVLTGSERMSFADIELAIADFAVRARDNKLKINELEGGTFTITNGGIFGSMLSTPIVNPPQSGILGLHAIQDRPVARDGQVVIRPMMYVALTYDHRIVDGREAVGFLRRIKEVIEEPPRMLVEI